jgi:hypothetical protein
VTGGATGGVALSRGRSPKVGTRPPNAFTDGYPSRVGFSTVRRLYSSLGDYETGMIKMNV